MTDQDIGAPACQGKNEPPRRDFLRGMAGTAVATAAAMASARARAGDDADLIRLYGEWREAYTKAGQLSAKWDETAEEDVGERTYRALGRSVVEAFQAEEMMVTRICAVPALTAEGRRAKGAVLSRYLPDEIRDLPIDQLTRSLCQDLMGVMA